MIRLSPLALAGALIATSCTVAFASPSQAARSVTVSYADLDLATSAGRAALDARLDRAVSRVCAQDDIRDLNGMLTCRHATRAALHQDVMLALRSGPVRVAMGE